MGHIFGKGEERRKGLGPGFFLVPFPWEDLLSVLLNRSYDLSPLPLHKTPGLLQTHFENCWMHWSNVEQLCILPILFEILRQKPFSANGHSASKGDWIMSYTIIGQWESNIQDWANGNPIQSNPWHCLLLFVKL